MTDLREAARTARSYVISRDMTPAQAWDEAAKKLSGKARSSYAKTTFLGLCEAGLVKGVPPGDYADRSGDMARYAARMIEMLVEDDEWEYDPQELFAKATEGKVQEQGQVDVVFGLWNHGLIDEEAVQKPSA
jgi:hypothetical protein